MLGRHSTWHCVQTQTYWAQGMLTPMLRLSKTPAGPTSLQHHLLASQAQTGHRGMWQMQQLKPPPQSRQTVLAQKPPVKAKLKPALYIKPQAYATCLMVCWRRSLMHSPDTSHEELPDHRTQVIHLEIKTSMMSKIGVTMMAYACQDETAIAKAPGMWLGRKQYSCTCHDRNISAIPVCVCDICIVVVIFCTVDLLPSTVNSHRAVLVNITLYLKAHQSAHTFSAAMPWTNCFGPAAAIHQGHQARRRAPWVMETVKTSASL